MIAKNTTPEALEAALVAVNEKYNGNVVWKRAPEQTGRRLRFTLTVKDSAGPGGRRSAPDWGNGKQRRIAAACWHAHGDFFDCLFEIDPETVVETGLAGKRVIDRNGGNWEDYNIGSMMYPFYASDACECDN